MILQHKPYWGAHTVNGGAQPALCMEDTSKRRSNVLFFLSEEVNPVTNPHSYHRVQKMISLAEYMYQS